MTGVEPRSGPSEPAASVTDADVARTAGPDPSATVEPTRPAAPARRPLLSPGVKRALRIGISVVLVAAILWYVFRQFADLSSVWRVIKALTLAEGALLAVATIWNLATYWVVMVVATPGLRLPQAAVLTQSTTAVANAVPAGGAVAVGLTYTILSSWGFSKSRTTLSVVVTGIWNNFIKLGMPIAALALLALQGERSGGRTVAAIAGLGGLVGAVVLFALILRSEAFAAKVGVVTARWASAVLKVFRRPPATGWDLAVTKWRGRVIGLVRHRWLSLTVSTLVSHLSLYAVLLIALRVVGVSSSDVGWAAVLAVFAFARLVTAIPLTPGGVGVVELALIAGLTSAGGSGARVVAAVLLYRGLTYVLPIALGALTYVYWRRNHSWRNSAPPMPPSMTEGHESADAPVSLDGSGARTAVGTATDGSPVGSPDGKAQRVEASPPDERLRRRSRRIDLITLGVALAVTAASAAAARGGLIVGEGALFSAVNGLPDAVYPVIWPFMQYGVFLTIPVLSVLALLFRRFRLAIAMALSGVGVYLLAKVLKEVVERGRPEALVAIVTERETFAEGSLGYPSGHVAVAAALTVVVVPYLRGRWKLIPPALLVIVCFGRMYVAAHVPLDQVGGAALGAAAGALANLIVRPPETVPPWRRRPALAG